jgi:phosphoglycolate phosphatase-like HAD superfamily hydrolase
VIRLLALDFDGVISDSAPEAFAVALRCYAELRPDSGLRERAAQLSGGSVPPPGSIAGDGLFAGFVELMPFGNRAEDYAVVLAALEQGRDLPDQAAYDAFRAGQDPEWLRAYHRHFYRVRASLMQADPEAWRRLMEPYASFLGILRRRASQVVLAIATAKDRRSVAALLCSYGIDDLFPEDRVLDKETGVTKASHLEHLHRICGVEYPEMAFVDDKLNHLDAVAPLGVDCCLAAWGYNGPREAALARSCGYRVCTLEDVEAQLFGRARV